MPCRIPNLTLEPSRKEEYAPKQRANTASKIKKKKKNLLFTNLLFTNPKNRLVILNKISKFGENYSLWQVTGIKKKKKKTNNHSEIKRVLGSLSPFSFLGLVDVAKANIFIPSLHMPALSSNCFPLHQFKV